MSKINIAQLAAFRDGEVLTEKKLNEIFTLIGTTLNVQDELYLHLVKDLQSLKIARRYLGTVENYGAIEQFVNSNKNNPIYQPPNEPLPSNGDVIFVKDNSDDPNLPAGQRPGSYMYIYTAENKWLLYSPFAMVNADLTQDGLMSKESFRDLETVKTDTTNLFKKYNDLKGKVDQIDTDITTTFRKDIDTLKSTKQDIKTKKGDTFLKGYTTETVEGNLVEVKEQVDYITSTSIVIWEKEDSDTFTYETVDNTHYKIYINIDKKDAFVSDAYIKCYFSYPGRNGLDQAIQTTLLVLSDSKNTGYGFAAYYDVDLNDWIDLQIRYVFDATASDENKQYYFEINLFNKDTLDSPIAINNLKPIKVIKDLGVSDYLWAELLEKDIKEFLKNYMGIKKYVCYSNTNTNDFNGFRAGDTLTLDYYYLYGAKSLEVNVGGLVLTQGIEWEEYADNSATNSFANQIKFLRDVNIDEEGLIEVVGFTVIVNSMNFKIWNKKDLYQVGEIVIEDNSLWYAKEPNVNKRPSENKNIWKALSYSIDLDSLKREITDYINQLVGKVVPENVKEEVKDQLKQLPTVDYISEGPGVEMRFYGQDAYETYKQIMGIDDSYFVDKNDSQQSTIDLENVVFKNKENKLLRPNTFNDQTIFNKNISLRVNGQDSGDPSFLINVLDENTLQIGNTNFKSLLQINKKEDNKVSVSVGTNADEVVVEQDNDLLINKIFKSQMKDLKRGITSLFNTLNQHSTNITDLLNRVNDLEQYSKTGIIQVVIWNQNDYKIRLIPLLTPPHLVGRENEFFERIHISTTTSYVANDYPNNKKIYQEWDGGNYAEIQRPQMNTDITVNSLNTANFRDLNVAMNIYSWFAMNQSLISPIGNWAPKIIVPITSRYDRNGQTFYIVYKAVN